MIPTNLNELQYNAHSWHRRRIGFKLRRKHATNAHLAVWDVDVTEVTIADESVDQSESDFIFIYSPKINRNRVKWVTRVIWLLIIVAAWSEEICRLLYVCFCGLRRQQSWRSLSVDISERGRRNGTKFWRQVQGDWCTPPLRPVTFDPRGPLRSQNIEGCKKICNAFLQGGFADLDEIWHDWGL